MQEKVKILFYVKFACLKFLILNGFIIILIGQFTVDKDEWNTFINTMKTKLEENVEKAGLLTQPWIKKAIIGGVLFAVPTLGLSLIFLLNGSILYYIHIRTLEIQEMQKFVISESKRYFEGQGFKLELFSTQINSMIVITPLGTSKKKEIEIKEEEIQIKNIELTDLENIQVELLQGDGFSKDDAIILVINKISSEDLSFMSESDIDKLNISVKGKVEIRKSKK
jgi:hypothetical protein